MNQLEIKGDWNILKGLLKQKRAKLTDDDLQFVAGQEVELMGRIQKCTGATWAQVEQAIQDFSAGSLAMKSTEKSRPPIF